MKRKKENGDVFRQIQENLGELETVKARCSTTHWKQKAKRARKRESKNNTYDREERDKLASFLQQVYNESNKCRMCFAKMEIGEGWNWNCTSIDRIVPGVHGGLYREENIQMICLGCNFIKDCYPLDQARLLIWKMARVSWTTDNNGFLNTACQPVQLVTAAEHQLMDEWVKFYLRKQKRLVRATKVIYFRLTESQLRQFFRQHYIGNGMFQDVANIKGPVPLFSIDRIDSSGHYELGNIRLLNLGLNRIKAEDEDDNRIILYLNHLKSKEEILHEYVDRNSVLPLQRTMIKFLSYDADGKKEFKKIEACHIQHHEKYDENNVVKTTL